MTLFWWLLVAVQALYALTAFVFLYIREMIRDTKAIHASLPILANSPEIPPEIGLDACADIAGLLIELRVWKKFRFYLWIASAIATVLCILVMPLVGVGIYVLGGLLVESALLVRWLYQVQSDPCE